MKPVISSAIATAPILTITQDPQFFPVAFSHKLLYTTLVTKLPLHLPAPTLPLPLFKPIILTPLFPHHCLTSITAIPTSSLESGHINSRIKNSDTSSKRKHTSHSPPQQVNKLPRIRANHTLPETFPATTSNISAPPAYFTDFVESNSARLTEILQAVIQGNLQNQSEREEDRQDIIALKAHNALSDRCEVVIFGSPVNTETYKILVPPNIHL